MNGSQVSSFEILSGGQNSYVINETSNDTGPIPAYNNDDSVSVILIPTSIIIFLIGAAIIIFVILRRRNRRQHDRLQFTPVYYSVEHEENEWESHLMDEELGKHMSIVKKPSRGAVNRPMF